MTYLYEYFRFPETYSVVCPVCGKECTGRDVSYEIKDWRGRRVVPSHQINKGLGRFDSRLSCLHCGLNKKYTINWPADAYWQCDVKGKVIWFWSMEHVSVVKEYLKSNQRDAFKYKFSIPILHIPKHFKLAKNRDSAIKAISVLSRKNT